MQDAGARITAFVVSGFSASRRMDQIRARGWEEELAHVILRPDGLYRAEGPWQFARKRERSKLRGFFAPKAGSE
jgi:hypothetical protein